MAARVLQMSRWALLPVAPLLFVVMFIRTVWDEGRPEWREGLANSAMALVLMALGLLCAAGLKPN